MVPLYLRYIPLNLYGAWLATGNILAWFTMFDPGLSLILMQRTGVAYGKGDVDEINSLLTSGLVISSLVSIVLLAVGMLSKNYLIAWLNLNPITDVTILKDAFVLAVVGSALLIFSYGITSINQGLQSSTGMGLIHVTAMVISLFITVIFLKHGAGLLALPIGLITKGLVFTLGNAIYLAWRYRSEHMCYKFTTNGILSLVKLSSHTFLGQSAQIMSLNADTFLLTRYLGPESAVVFSFTRKIPEVSQMMLERPAVAFMPAISNLVGCGEIDKARSVLLRLTQIILWLMGLLASGFFVFNRDFISLWVGRSMYAGSTINSIIILSLVGTVIIKSLSNLCFSMGDISVNSIVKMLQGLMSVAFMYIGTKLWGMTGLAIAPLLSMLLISFWYYPRSFSRLLTLKRPDVIVMVQEFTAVVAASSITIILFISISATSWGAFVLTVLMFSIVYTGIMLTLSNSLRKELIGMLNKIQIV